MAYPRPYVVDTTTTEVSTLADSGSSNNNNTLILGTPVDVVLNYLVQACADAAVKEMKGEKAGNGGQAEAGEGDGSPATIIATAAVCLGARLVDCYVVKLYRFLKRWEWAMDHEQRGNLILN